MQLSPAATCGLLLVASNVFCIMGAVYFIFRG
jgi:hypothetical protein